MNTRSIFQSFRQGYGYPGIKSNYLWVIFGAGITGALYALGEPEIGKYSALATSTLCAANLTKQYKKGKLLLEI